MTYQIEVQKCCKFCGNTMNYCGDRGNGKKRDFCERECTTKHYILKKRIVNYMAHMKLREYKFQRTGEFSEKTFKFMQLANQYIENNLPAIRLAQHINAALDGKKIMVVESVFKNLMENKGKDKCLI